MKGDVVLDLGSFISCVSRKSLELLSILVLLFQNFFKKKKKKTLCKNKNKVSAAATALFSLLGLPQNVVCTAHCTDWSGSMYHSREEYKLAVAAYILLIVGNFDARNHERNRRSIFVCVLSIRRSIFVCVLSNRRKVLFVF